MWDLDTCLIRTVCVKFFFNQGILSCHSRIHSSDSQIYLPKNENLHSLIIDYHPLWNLYGERGFPYFCHSSANASPLLMLLTKAMNIVHTTPIFYNFIYCRTFFFHSGCTFTSSSRLIGSLFTVFRFQFYYTFFCFLNALKRIGVAISWISREALDLRSIAKKALVA